MTTKRRRPALTPMPDWDGLTIGELKAIAKASHLLIRAFDAGREDSKNEARVINFEIRMEALREATYKEVDNDRGTII